MVPTPVIATPVRVAVMVFVASCDRTVEEGIFSYFKFSMYFDV